MKHDSKIIQQWSELFQTQASKQGDKSKFTGSEMDAPRNGRPVHVTTNMNQLAAAQAVVQSL